MKDFFLKLFGYDVRKPKVGMKLRGRDDGNGLGSDIIVEIAKVSSNVNKTRYKFLTLRNGVKNLEVCPDNYSVYNWHWFINDTFEIIEE